MADSYRASVERASMWGGGSPDVLSNVSSPKNNLGDRMQGVDSSGFWGEWVYCVAHENLTAKAPLAVLSAATSYSSLRLGGQFRVASPESIDVTSGDGLTSIVGLVDQACDAGKYVWVRTLGVVLAAPWTGRGFTAQDCTPIVARQSVGAGNQNKWTIVGLDQFYICGRTIQDRGLVDTTADIELFRTSI